MKLSALQKALLAHRDLMTLQHIADGQRHWHLTETGAAKASQLRKNTKKNREGIER